MPRLGGAAAIHGQKIYASKYFCAAAHVLFAQATRSPHIETRARGHEEVRARSGRACAFLLASNTRCTCSARGALTVELVVAIALIIALVIADAFAIAIACQRARCRGIVPMRVVAVKGSWGSSRDAWPMACEGSPISRPSHSLLDLNYNARRLSECIWVHSSVVRAADCRSAGPWFKSGCALKSFITWQHIWSSTGPPWALQHILNLSNWPPRRSSSEFLCSMVGRHACKLSALGGPASKLKRKFVVCFGVAPPRPKLHGAPPRAQGRWLDQRDSCDRLPSRSRACCYARGVLLQAAMKKMSSPPQGKTLHRKFMVIKKKHVARSAR